MMVTFSAMTAYLLSGSPIHLAFVFLITGVFLLSAGASVLNQIQEYKQDSLMGRTSNRPIPSGAVSISNAFRITVVLIGSGAILLLQNGKLPMYLGLLNIVLYNLVYTPIKKRSWLSIVPGALVGGVPPLIGWSSAGSSLFHPQIIFLFIFICLWQIPHFWLLMIKYGEDYVLAGFRSITMSLNEKQVKVIVFGWGAITSLFLMVIPLFKFVFHPFLLGVIILTNLFFISSFYQFLFRSRSAKSIQNAFVLINSFALIIFILLVVNAFVM
jgi:protoheme IX farnesyltransferase